MFDKSKMVLGVIPARGGSKGIVKKNIRKIAGKPLISYAIECGLKCPSIDHLIVSTDDDEIAQVARENGADVPFIRPAELAEDTTPMLPVLSHSLIEAEKIFNEEYDALVLLDPTGPLRTVEDVEGCIELFYKLKYDAVVSGNVAHRNPYFNMVVKEHGRVQLAINGDQSVFRRQDAPQVYDLNTVVWVYSRKTVMAEERMPDNTGLFIIPEERSIDIDTEQDIELLEYILKKSTPAK